MHGVFYLVTLGWLTILLGAVVLLLLRDHSKTSRVVAFDSFTVFLIATLAVIARRTGGAYYLDAAVALALLSFVGTLAVARFRSGERLFP